MKRTALIFAIAGTLGLVAAFERRLEEIDATIHVAAQGKYGICERCGAAIAPERLEIFPEPLRAAVVVLGTSTGGGTLVHEIVHPFMRANFPNCPSWFDEGLASLYAHRGFEAHADQFGASGAVEGRCRAAWSMPVATTDTRMMPSRLSSKVAPTMILAS